MENDPPHAEREVFPTTARLSIEANRSEIRAVFSARSWLDAIRRCLLVIAAIASATAILSAISEPIPPRDDIVITTISLVVLGASLSLVTLLRRRPIVGLRAVWVACALAAVVAFLGSEPSVRHEWRVLKRGAESWFFAGTVGVFIVLPYLVAHFSRGATPLGVGAAVTVIAFLASTCEYLDPRFALPLALTILLFGVTMALRRVEAAWPAIERHPEWFLPPAVRPGRYEGSRTDRVEHQKASRGATGIARSYLRWKRLNRPAIRSGGVGGLGLK